MTLFYSQFRVTPTHAPFVSDDWCSGLSEKCFLQCPCLASMAGASLCINTALWSSIVPILSQFLRIFSAGAVGSRATDREGDLESELLERDEK